MRRRSPGCADWRATRRAFMGRAADVVPIPGTKRPGRLAENIGAAMVTLTAEELRRIDEIAPVGAAAGDRYTDMSWVNR